MDEHTLQNWHMCLYVTKVPGIQLGHVHKNYNNAVQSEIYKSI